MFVGGVIMNNRDINSELSKLDSNKYQTIIIDKDSKQIQISEPWHGKILYQLGYRTDISELSRYLMSTITNSSNKIKNSVTSEKNERYETLTMIKIFSKVLKNKEFENLSENEQYLTNINEIKSNIRKTIPQTLKPEEIEEISYFDKENTTITDRLIQDTQLKMIDQYNKAKKSYKLIEMKTCNLNPTDNQSETITFHNFNTNTEEKLQVYHLDPSQPFMVHSTSLTNVLPLIKRFDSHNLPFKTMCTSLIGSNNIFFHFEEDTLALILTIDPNIITLTASFDTYTPASHKPQEAYQFYSNQKKLFLLTSRINEIHESTGLVNEVQEYIALEKSLFDVIHEIKGIEEKINRIKMDPIYSVSIKKAEERKELINSLSSLSKIKRERQRELVQELKSSNIVRKYAYVTQTLNPEVWKLAKYESRIQILQLIDYYKKNPEKNNSPEEFIKIFRYAGSGILEELNKYEKMLIGLQEKYPQMRFQKLMNPAELLSTQKRLTHNEINIKLDTQGARPTEAKGLIVSRKTLERYTTKLNPDELKYDKEKYNKYLSFLSIIQHAKEHNRPIYIIEGKKKQRARAML